MATTQTDGETLKRRRRKKKGRTRVDLRYSSARVYFVSRSGEMYSTAHTTDRLLLGARATLSRRN